jgi:hypothetical protein
VSDYTELNLYLEDGNTINLWIYLDNNKPMVIKDVSSNPVRYQGWWSISHSFIDRPAVAMIEDSKIMYFVTIGDNNDRDK